jgi:hypothetical protein
MTNVRKAKNYIGVLKSDSEAATIVHVKHQRIYNHFQNHIASCFPRSYAFNYEELRWQPQQLHHLDLPFSEAEVEKTIKSMPKEKALGSDDFIGIFFQKLLANCKR